MTTTQTDVPLVIRLADTDMEQGHKILDDSGLDIITADTLADAVDKAAAAWQQAKGKG